MKHGGSLFLAWSPCAIAVPFLDLARERTLRQGHVWKFRTAPVDPVDAFRGRYVALEFEAEAQQISPPPNAPYGRTIFVTLRADAEGFAVIDQVLPDRPDGDDFIEAQLHGTTVALPFDKYWVTERDAPAAEAAYLAQSAREKRNAFMTVRVLKATPRSRSFISMDCRSGEYLRANAPK